MSAAPLVDQLLTHSEEDRATAARRLIASLPRPGAWEGSEDAWIERVDARARSLDEGSTQAVPLDEVRARFSRPRR